MAKPAGRLRAFIAELKRRRVFRVASIYLVAAWVAVQVATTVSPLMNLPFWLPKAVLIAALVGFPAALIFSWAFDLTSEGLERTDEVTTVGGHEVHPLAVRVRWLRPVVALLTVVLLLGAVYVIWLRLAGRGQNPDAISIAILPFTVQGGPGVLYLREGMVDLLSTKLDGAGDLRSVSPTAIIQAMGPNAPKDVSTSYAARMANQFDAALFVMGSVTELDGRVSIAAGLYDAKNPANGHQAIVQGAKDSLGVLVDQLAIALLSERYSGPAMRMARTAALTTNSTESLKAYLSAESEYRASRWQTATDWFKRALEQDSTFALAAYGLAAAAEWSGDYSAARSAAAQAKRAKQRLGERDALLLEGLDAWLNGAPESAEVIYRRLTADYPDESEAWYRLGEVLFHYNPMRGRPAQEARVPFARALALNPGVEAIRLHMLELALYDHDFAAFDTLIKSVDVTGEAALRRTAVRTFASGDSAAITRLSRDLAGAGDATIFVVATGLAEYNHDFANAEHIASFLLDPKRTWLAHGMGQLFLAQLDVGRGRWNAATQRLAALDTLGSCRRGGWLEICSANARAYRALYAVAPTQEASAVELQNIAVALTAWNAEKVRSAGLDPAALGANDHAHTILRGYLLGLIAAQLGDSTNSLSQAKLLAAQRTTGPESALPDKLALGVRAQNALHAGDATRALQSLEQIHIKGDVDLVANSPFYASAHERMLRAEALHALGRDKDALSWYASLAQGRTALYLMGPSLFRRAQIEEKAGDNKAAAAHYKEFIGLWSECDARFRPRVDEAKQHLQKLSQA